MTAAALTSAAGERSSFGWLLIAGITLAAVTEAVASTALSLGRSDIIGDTHATPDEFAWLDVGYVALKLIGFACAPWLLTRASPRICLIAATLAMGAACGAAALSTRLDVLIVLRMAQGIAGAILLVSGQAILFRDYPRASQPVLQAIFAMGSVVAPATIAPALEGWLLDAHSWTWIFFGILPAALLAAGFILLGDTAPAAAKSEPRQFDGLGLALLGAALFAVTYVLSQGSRWDWLAAGQILWPGLLACAAFGLFVIRQRSTGSRGLLDLTVFKVDGFTFAFAVSFVAGAALSGSAFLIPAFAVSVLTFTPTDAGLLLLPSGVVFAGALLIAAFLIGKRRVPPFATIPAGILLLMAAMWMLSYSSAQSGPPDMMPAILLRGLGLGFLFLSITLIAFSQLPPAALASGIALFSIGRQLGGLMGVAGLQTLIDHQVAGNQAVIGANIGPGSPALAERLASATALLIDRGMEASAAAKAATSLLSRAVAGQAATIAFNTAFGAVTLLFVVGVPAVVGLRIALARAAKRRAQRQAATAQ
jgi:MFS transporter, DHA2 family, multidrug resistance protein